MLSSPHLGLNTLFYSFSKVINDGFGERVYIARVIDRSGRPIGPLFARVLGRQLPAVYMCMAVVRSICWHLCIGRALRGFFLLNKKQEIFPVSHSLILSTAASFFFDAASRVGSPSSIQICVCSCGAERLRCRPRRSERVVSDRCCSPHVLPRYCHVFSGTWCI